MLVEHLKPYAEVSQETAKLLRADQEVAEAKPCNAHERATQQFVGTFHL